MEVILENVVRDIEIGTIQNHAELSIAPLTLKEETGPDYLTMSQGFEAETIQVEEISDAGSVPELSVVNRGEQHVLLLDGEEIRGAKQNRVLNTSILVAPGSKCVIPVSCTEQGRWDYTTKSFEDSGVFMSPSMRQRKQASVTENVRARHKYFSNQADVWDTVQQLHSNLNTTSGTGAMRDAYTTKQQELNRYAEAFLHIDGTHGFAAFLGGRLAGIDLVSRSEAMKSLFPKLLGSYAMDAIALRPAKMKSVPDQKMVRNSLAQLERCALEPHKSQGVGDDVRLDGPELQGAALVAFNALIHLSIFRKQKKSFEGGMTSFSRRRNFRSSR